LHSIFFKEVNTAREEKGAFSIAGALKVAVTLAVNVLGAFRRASLMATIVGNARSRISATQVPAITTTIAIACRH
jgi:hypothetical protein